MDKFATTCSRCRAEIVVMSAGEYLSSTNDDLDFALHAHDRESQLAITTEAGGFTCPSCGAHHRLPPPHTDAASTTTRKIRVHDASTS